MGADTKIEWTDKTWNPVRGCSVVSAGCKHCYAMKVAARFSGAGLAYEGLALRSPARWTGKVRLVEKDLEAPAHWRKPQKIFVNSMSDLFHEQLQFEQIADVFRVMAYPECARHTFQVLTKRPQRMRDFFAWAQQQPSVAPWPDGGVVLPNVWLGVSVEDQRAADERIPHLLRVPAAVRFLSVEPLLGPVDLTRVGAGHLPIDARNGGWGVPRNDGRPLDGHRGIDWVIVGGESGPGARPCDVAWILGVVEQCREAGVPVFVKQLGAKPYELSREHVTLSGPPGVVHYSGDVTVQEHVVLQDPKGGDPLEWPSDLRVREFPEVRT